MAMRKLVPINDKIIVRRDEADEKTEGGLYIPDTAQKKPKRGEVLAVGEGRLLDDGTRAEMCVKRGDVVLFNSYAGSDVELDGEEYLVLSEADVLAKVE